MKTKPLTVGHGVQPRPHYRSGFSRESMQGDKKNAKETEINSLFKVRRWLLLFVALIPLLLLTLLLLAPAAVLNQPQLRTHWLPALAQHYGVSLFYQGVAASWTDGFTIHALQLGLPEVSFAVRDLAVDRAHGVVISRLAVDIQSTLPNGTAATGDRTVTLPLLPSWLPLHYRIQQFSVQLPQAMVTGSVYATVGTHAAQAQLAGKWQFNDRYSALQGDYRVDLAAQLPQMAITVKQAVLLADGLSLKAKAIEVGGVLQGQPEIAGGSVEVALDSARLPPWLRARFSKPVTLSLAAEVAGRADDMRIHLTKMSLQQGKLLALQGKGRVRLSGAADDLLLTMQGVALSGWLQLPPDLSSTFTDDRADFNVTMDGYSRYQLSSGDLMVVLDARLHLQLADWQLTTRLKMPALQLHDQNAQWEPLQLDGSLRFHDQAAASFSAQVGGSSNLSEIALRLQRVALQLHPGMPLTHNMVDRFKLALHPSTLRYRQGGHVVWNVSGNFDLDAPPYHTRQAQFSSVGQWSDATLQLKSLEFTDVSNGVSTTMQGALRLLGKGGFSPDIGGSVQFQDLSKLAVLGLPLKLNGSSAIAWTLRRVQPDSSDFLLSARVTAADVALHHARFALRGLSINLPLSQRFRLSKGGVLLLLGQRASSSTLDRVMMDRKAQGLPGNIAVEEVSVDGTNWGSLVLGADWQHGTLSLAPLSGALLGGEMGGNIRLQLPRLLDKNLLQKIDGDARLNWVGIDSGMLIGKQGKRGTFNLFATLSKQGKVLRGRFSVLEIGRKTVLNMIDWVDSKEENHDLQNVKKLMVTLGFAPDGVDAVLNDRYLDVDVALKSRGGNNTHVKINNLAVVQFIEDFL